MLFLTPKIRHRICGALYKQNDSPDADTAPESDAAEQSDAVPNPDDEYTGTSNIPYIQLAIDIANHDIHQYGWGSSFS